jgi:crotonobetainyl-CoA:carnitine CoA-transferase CaiB-like acyl-CoA transferase
MQQRVRDDRNRLDRTVMTENSGALAGIKVVDLSRVLAGPYATQILGDHGADVIKVEPPAGDETREWGPPFRDGDAASGASAYYININRNKRGMALDLTKPEAREIVFRLLADADVLVENFKIGTLEKWGMGTDVLSAKFPKLVHARVTGFGADGPLGGMPGYDAIVQTMVSLSSCNGSPESGTGETGRADGRHDDGAQSRDRHPDGARRAAAVGPRAVCRGRTL